MPFLSKRSDLVLSPEDRAVLQVMSKSRTEAFHRVQRASLLLRYAGGEPVSAIARALGTSRPLVDRCLDKALQLGPMAALDDLPGRGRPRAITDEDEAWVVNLACQRPKELGYPHALWTTDLLSRHVRAQAVESGHPSLARLGRGTTSKILRKREVKPHKIKYYLERRDPEFDAKMVDVLCVYREVSIIRDKGDISQSLAILSYDEKPGIQAIGTTAPDLPPVPGEHSCISRDHEYVRHGTVTLMAAIDLLDGRVHGHVVERHRSREFIDLLKHLDRTYEHATKIRIVLDNHSAHISKETRSYLNGTPNRFDFVFTPKHGSWLNLIEVFFSKLARAMLRGIRVASKEELKER